MKLEVFPSGPVETNAYIVGCENTGEAAIIDPAPGSAPALIDYLENNSLKLNQIILTHSHWDHIGDTAILKEKFHVPVIIHQLDAPNLEQPGADGLPLLFRIEGVVPDSFMDEGDIVKIGNLDWKVIHTPGHTPGGVCLYCEKEKTLLAGDTLFKRSIGNLSFPMCEPEKMWTSLDKLAKLPPETKVYSGHGPSTTIGEEPWLPNAKKIFGGL